MRQLNPGYCHCFLLYYYFFLFSLYFTLQVKPRPETSQGAPLPHQTTGNTRNGSSLRLASPSDQRGGYGKRTAVDYTVANTGIFLLFCPFLTGSTRMPLTVSWLILHGTNWLHKVLPPPCCQPPPSPRLTIGALNIWYGWGFGLAQVIQALERGGINVMLLTETKIMTEAYSHNRLGYHVACLEVRTYRAGGAQDGVDLVTR